MSEGLEEARRFEGEPDEERREDVTEVETEREEAPAPPAEEGELPAEEDELPRLRGPEHATGELQTRALEELERAGVGREAVTVVPVPGAFELPLAAMALAKTRRYSCIVALGAVVRGDTPHFDYVASEAASGLQLAGLETGVPVAFGVLTCDSEEQARERLDKGGEAALTALEMADVFSQLRAAAGS